MKKKGLGKGLEALMGSHTIIDNSDNSNSSSIGINELHVSPFQPRTVFDEKAIETLADSIRQYGIIQPLAVREIQKDGSKHFEIVAGERRFRAAKIAGLTEIPVVIRDIDDNDAATLALVENLQREDLNAIEKAKGISRLINDFNLTHSDCGELLGQSRPAITNILRLLELDDEVQQAVINKSIDMGHARALLSLEKAEQCVLLKQIQVNGLSVRETEALVKETQAGTKPNTAPRNKKTQQIKQTEMKLSEHLRTKVNISQKSSGSGKITLSFADEEMFKKLLHQLGIE